MDDLISRQAAIDAFEKRTHIDWESLKILHPMFEVLEDLPSAERRGRWIVKHGVLAGDGIYGDMGECSVCGLHLRNYEWDYCPNCGAIMDKEENDELVQRRRTV